MEIYDIIIVGAGPAGLCLASELANSNQKILVLDKKKNAEDIQYNTSGSFIDPVKWNLPSSILNPINRVYFASKNETAIKQGKAYIINRKKLLNFFENKAKNNNNFKVEYKATITQINLNKKHIKNIIYSKNNVEKSVSAKIFVDCSGTSFILGRKIGLSPSKPIIAVGVEYLVPLKKGVNESDLFVGSNLKGGYGWIFPIDSKTTIIGYGSLSKECFSEVETRLQKMWEIDRVSERCKFKPIKKHIAVLRTGKPLNKFTENNLVIIGDSALQANPLVGEGIRFVMDSAKIAAKYIKASIKNNDLNLLKNYSREWRKKYYRKYKIAYMLQQKIKKYSSDDAKLDYGVKRLNNLSDNEFVKLLSGDLSYLFLFRVFLKSLLNYKKIPFNIK